MYLAPLNFDRFFKKVFSDLHISKSFLEDFLNVQIETIELMPNAHKITDDAAAVEFDFRCKINGHYVIIDMQQWYKTDIVKRFYLYHALNSALQLELLTYKSLPIDVDKKYKTKNYAALMPTITLIWMADDNLKFEEDYVAFALYPEQAADFIKNEALWSEFDAEKIDIERQKALTLLNNNAKELDFLPQNRLIYAFQKNIVKNKKYSKYFKWFDLAEKTANKNNTKKDFVLYEKDEILMKVIRRINMETLKPYDSEYIDDYNTTLKEIELWNQTIRDEGMREGKLEGKLQGKIEGKEETIELVVISAHEEGLTPLVIAAITKLPIKKVIEIIEKHKSQLKNGAK